MTAVSDVLDLARQQIGEYEHPQGSNRTKYGKWYGMDGVAWCAMFVSWVFHHAGLPLPATTSKGFSYTPSGAAWFRKQGRWLSQYDTTVRPGDVVFFYWPNMARIAHVGIVEQVRDNGDIVTIEGNTDAAGGREGGEVMRRLRSRATVGRYGGFGRPDLQEGDLDVDEAKLRKIIKEEIAKADILRINVDDKGGKQDKVGIDHFLKAIALKHGIIKEENGRVIWVG